MKYFIIPLVAVGVLAAIALTIMVILSGDASFLFHAR